MKMSVTGVSVSWWVLAIFGTLSLASSLVLEGSPFSYAQFRKWFVTRNGSLELEFKTEEPNGLLVYTDDGGTFDFFELKIVEGTMRLRYNLGSGASILTVGKNLSDNRWHRVAIVRNDEDTRLLVDQMSVHKTTRGAEMNFGNFITNSYVYVGGVPDWYVNKLQFLALPSVYYELRFKGHIRNVLFADSDGPSRRQDVIESKGVRTTKKDNCDTEDPCLNGGICISTDNGAFCDCRFIDFEGALCEKDRAPSVAAFHGSDYLSYDISKEGGEPIASSSDQISFYFKSKEANGLLFFTGHKKDFLSLALKDGSLQLNINLGSGSQEKHIKSHKLRFDDNLWHNVTVRRKIKEISGGPNSCQITVIIDGVHPKMDSISGLFNMLYSSIIYIGGSPSNSHLPEPLGKKNFVGCLRKVEFSADGLKFNPLGLATTNNLITIHGNVQFTCQEMDELQPIMFTTSESYLVDILPTWDTIKAGQISFKIRTNEPNGLLMLNSGTQNTAGDVFAIELFEGYIYLVLNLGSGSTKIKSTSQRIDDKQWHTISFSRKGKSGRFTVDDSATDFITPGEASQLDLMGSLLLGGFGSSLKSSNFPGDIWTASLGYGYIGCMSDLVVNGKTINLTSYVKNQNAKGILPYCHAENSQCHSSPCMNGGICLEGWNRFVCDCAGTHYTGKICDKVAGVLTFNGKQYMKVSMTEESQTQVEVFSIRFRTSHPNGLLIATKTDKTPDRVQAGLTRGKIRFAINLGEKEKVIYAGDQLHDNQWHTLRVKRYGHAIELNLDQKSKISDVLPGKHTTLDFSQILVGSLETNPTQFSNDSLKPEHLRSFIGHLQQFIFINQPYIELAKNRSGFNIELTAVVDKIESLIHRAVRFRSKHAFIGLSSLKNYAFINIYFQLKTSEPNGLIFYNKGKGHDFIAVELVNGRLHFVFQLGDGLRSITSKTKLNDNKWHEVTVERTAVNKHVLVVDGVITSLDSNGKSSALDLDGILYLGGVPMAIYDFLPKTVKSKHGFEGCLGLIDVNGEYIEPIADAIIPSAFVTLGCDDLDKECHPNSCYNKGVCIQKQNGYVCDCDMTSYVGPKCADDGVAYEFGPNNGIVTFTFPLERRPDTKIDNFTMGFVTKQKQGLLVRIDSMTSPDYIELSLVDGSIVMTYNMGTADHSTDKIGNKLNDGIYHVVRVKRSGANSTVQLDDFDDQRKLPAGKQLVEFNSQSRIQIGGRQNTLKDTIEKPFEGRIAGFVFNGIRILDLAAKKDPRTYVHGDVKLIIPNPNDHINVGSNYQTHNDVQQTTAITNFEMEELVFSGSGCGVEDDEDCKSVFPSGNDDLITPVYIPPTPKPQKTTTTTPAPTTTTTTVRAVPTKSCDDDDDCDKGSGDGSINAPATKSMKLTTLPTLRQTTTIITTTSTTTTTTVSPRTYMEIDKPSFEIPSGKGKHDPDETRHDPPTDPGNDEFFHTTPTEPSELVPTRYDISHHDIFAPSGGNNVRESINNGHGHSNGDGIALVIGIIAGILSVVISIILLVFKFCVQSEGTYKIDESKNYQFSSIQGSTALLQHGSCGSYDKEPSCHPDYRNAPVAGMGQMKGLGFIINQGVNSRNIYGNNSSSFSNGHQNHPNGSVDNRDKKLSKKKDLKDVKEWYV